MGSGLGSELGSGLGGVRARVRVRDRVRGRLGVRLRVRLRLRVGLRVGLRAKAWPGPGPGLEHLEDAHELVVVRRAREEWARRGHLCREVEGVRREEGGAARVRGGATRVRGVASPAWGGERREGGDAGAGGARIKPRQICSRRTRGQPASSTCASPSARQARGTTGSRPRACRSAPGRVTVSARVR